jgi:hypothetical protein
MPLRVVAFLLAFVMLLTGLAAAEQAVAAPSLALDQCDDPTLVDAGRAGDAGSIVDDRADDLPAQPHADGEDSFLLESQCAAVDLPVTVALRYPFGEVILRSPFLEGPQRPPCSGPVLA